VSVFLYVFFVPKMWVGNKFFGEIPVLYQPAIAQLLYSQALQLDSKNGIPPPYAHYQLSRTYFIAGRFEEALLHANEELRYHPTNLRTHYIRGLTLGYMDREIEAIDAFGLFLKDKPTSWAARNDKAWLHFRIGDLQGALETILPAVDEFPENPWVMNTYGVVLMNQDRFTEAERALAQAFVYATQITEEDWGRAYPGNSPAIYGTGLNAMRNSIHSNMVRVHEELSFVES
jgi:tetratricopeptide (TPR) repeat protein